MDHYIDIQILPNPEIAAPLVMNQLFYQLHLLLVDGNNHAGISFPGYQHSQGGGLGSCIRLHGTAKVLTALDITRRVDGITDYAAVSEVLAVPEQVKNHAVFVRKHTKSPRDVERKRQHLLKKSGGEWNEEAQESLTRFIGKLNCNYPFAQLISHSSAPAKGMDKNHFYLFIDKRITPEKTGQFTKYGLSDPTNHATVPIF
ncbi:type I-F CRISPR-associated endoribonuclease Cas6/Csy4 [Budvicia diplopodorum]|uniref:type I-F CRISPR-associated endoribonuclease Cas6/Csy4 n=1 Tax=Budvicia diplopodorum TaxID=1119056 RepID=UPI001357A358|nr:type I-F CRISPR-associated endoribonuclease Cas6/Csy4 [Budvicia diplopodorum]